MIFLALLFNLTFFQTGKLTPIPVSQKKPFQCESIQIMNTSPSTDSTELSALNAQFIQNFIRQDAKAHAQIIHEDFVCIESNGSLVSRAVYLKNWATDYDHSGCVAFAYTDEDIRIFGNIALVRSKTIATFPKDGQLIKSYTIYTDTYLKENGKWQCIQVQITPIKDH